MDQPTKPRYPDVAHAAAAVDVAQRRLDDALMAHADNPGVNMTALARDAGMRLDTLHRRLHRLAPGTVPPPRPRSAPKPQPEQSIQAALMVLASTRLGDPKTVSAGLLAESEPLKADKLLIAAAAADLGRLSPTHRERVSKGLARATQITGETPPPMTPE